MPRPTRAHGRPDTEVIPTDWAASHRPVAEKTMRAATVELRHPGTTQAWDPGAEQMVDVPRAPYWTGTARVQMLATRDQVNVVVGDVEYVAQYRIVVPAAVAPTPADLCTVTVVDDAVLAGRTLTVGLVATGSLIWERDVYAALVS
ncbi:DUF6093 family protein [Nocardioides soli]|uniref:Uncharacterized protein n=1 Tax=Nocardioides soli TaxID=1036020 RepID=A0A7W4VTS8_9ACTN|nr:DUF6093 family protein [Nocardioides soli]MBB3041219.1 hypothetical protein [Nocardioides soli]